MKARYDIYDLDTLVASKVVHFSQGDTIFDALVNYFDVQQEETSDIIKTIDGYEQNGVTEFWLFARNHVYGDLGAKQYDLEEGDVIEWSLTRFD